MFKGSENVGPGELDFLIFTNGGNSNGTTNTDRTLYYEVLPKNQLDLGLFLEADRMRGLVITRRTSRTNAKPSKRSGARASTTRLTARPTKGWKS